jgi:glyoxylase-like metal-dependent hydrolase (beta-lactamase superfamily II)
MPNDIPFARELDFEYGVIQEVSPRIRRVVARNPSAFTLHGTGTYVIGHGNVAIVDPGPMVQEHVDALLDALKGETVTHILVTHTHIDHSPACAPVKKAVTAKTYGHGPHGSGKHEQGIKVEEGGDMDFAPDVTIRHGDVIEGDGWTVEAVHTPGHTSNHICFALKEENVLFSGDHVMGWSTSIISPPDGDMADYLASLRLLLEREQDHRYWPTHGPAIDRPQSFVRGFIGHRRMREQQILKHLGEGIETIQGMVPLMYKDVDPRLHSAAVRSVFAHMIHMVDTGRVAHEAELAVDARYRVA